MTDEALKAYLTYFWGYTPLQAQVIIDGNQDEDDRQSLEEFVALKKKQWGFKNA